MDNLYTRLDLAVPRITAIKSKLAQRDLIKMVRAIDKKLTEIDQELVECRRRQKNTLKFNELHEQATALLDNLEKHITFASLIS